MFVHAIRFVPSNLRSKGRFYQELRKLMHTARAMPLIEKPHFLQVLVHATHARSLYPSITDAIRTGGTTTPRTTSIACWSNNSVWCRAYVCKGLSSTATGTASSSTSVNTQCQGQTSRDE